MRIVDLETKSMNSPRPPASSRRRDSRIEEIANRLGQASKDSTRAHRSPDRTAKKMEEQAKVFGEKLGDLRAQVDQLVRQVLCGL